MKFLKKILILTLVTSVFFGCGKKSETGVSQKDENKNKVKVVTTIFPSYDFTREIAGDNVELTMLILPGTDAHSYDPSPQDIIKIHESDIFIYNGSGTDPWADKILDSLDYSNKEVIAMTEVVDTLQEEIVEGMQDDHDHDHDDHKDDDHKHDDHDDHKDDDHKHDDHKDDDHKHDDHKDDDHHHHEVDEHVWTSPKNAIKISRAITDALIEKNPENKTFYEDNLKAYIDKLHKLDGKFREIVENGNRKTFIFGDKFPLRYFAHEYNLDYYAAFAGCSNESEASPATIAFLIDKVKEEKIPVVFHIELSNQKIANTIAEETNAEVLEFHSYHNVSKEDFKDKVSYLELANRNLAILKEALK